MKRAKIPQQLAKNASKLHVRIGEILTSNPLFRNYPIRQEYAVSNVNPSFESNREKFDWAILGLNVVIEVMGPQHYIPICFGGISMEEAKTNLRKQQDRDERKQKAAQEAGWAYVVVKYSEAEITEQELSSRVSGAIKKISVEKSSEKIKALGAKRPKAKFHNRPVQQRKKHNWPRARALQKVGPG
jgi:hypothetical protein